MARVAKAVRPKKWTGGLMCPEEGGRPVDLSDDGGFSGPIAG
jgi:hypothetical protein